MDIRPDVRYRDRSGQATLEMMGQLPFLRGVPPGVLKTVAQVTRWRRYARREFVTSPDDDEGISFLLAAGQIGIVTASADREFIGMLLSPGHAFHLAGLPMPSGISVWAEAMAETVVVYRLPTSELEGLRRRFRSVDEALDQETIRSLLAVGAIALDLALFDTRARYFRTLGRLALTSEDHHVRFTQADISRLAAVSRAHISQLTDELETLGLVRRLAFRGGVLVLDPWALATYAGGPLSRVLPDAT